jgi:hypothetical protein
MGETLVEAFERDTMSRPAQSHYYAFQAYSDSELDTDEEVTSLFVVPSSDLSSDDDDDDSDHLGICVYAADRGVKKITQARKEVLDGVYPPTRKSQKENEAPPPLQQSEVHQKAKPNFGPLSTHPRPQNFPPTPNKYSSQPRQQYQPQQLVQPIQPTVQSQQGPPVQIPFDARKTRFHLPDDNDDIVMAEPAKPRKAPKRNDRLDKLAQEQQAEFGRPKIVSRAEIASELQDQQVIKNILNTPVTLPMREVLASSKELSDQLSDMIKRKATVAPITAQASSVPLRARAFLLEKSHGTLITLDVMCGNKPITAIIDTESQLNVVSEECWKQAI